MKGSYRRPAIEVADTLYAVTTGGTLVALSARAGAQVREVAQLQNKSACFNQSAIVDVTARNSELHGLSFVAVSPESVEAVSLVTGSVSVLYKARVDTPICANNSEADATAFRGLVANGELCAFGTYISPAKIALTIRYFSEDRAVESPLTLNGNRSLGPAMHGTLIALCTGEEVGLFDTANQSGTIVSLPAGFRSMLARTESALNVPPGAMPLAGFIGRDGYEVWIAGESGGRPGLLKVRMNEGRPEFIPLAEGSCLTTRSDGRLVVSSPEGISVSFETSVTKAPGRMEPGMPIYRDKSALCAFAARERRGWHHLWLSSEAATEDLWFEDAGCDEDSCCGIYVLESDVLVGWLDVSAGAQSEGLRFAHWGLQDQ